MGWPRCRCSGMTISNGTPGTASVWRYGRQPEAHPPVSRHGTRSLKDPRNMICRPPTSDGYIIRAARPIGLEPVQSSIWRNKPAQAGDVPRPSPRERPHGCSKIERRANKSPAAGPPKAPPMRRLPNQISMVATLDRRSVEVSKTPTLRLLASRLCRRSNISPSVMRQARHWG